MEDTLKTELMNLLKRRQQLAETLAQLDGAIGFARHLLTKAEAVAGPVEATTLPFPGAECKGEPPAA